VVERPPPVPGRGPALTVSRDSETVSFRSDELDEFVTLPPNELSPAFLLDPVVVDAEDGTDDGAAVRRPL